jgi:hypothetical protein
VFFLVNILFFLADWNSIITFIDNTTFTETGNVTFGTHMHNEHTLLFNTDANGRVFAAPTNEAESTVVSVREVDKNELII